MPLEVGGALRSNRASRHLPSASLGQDASLSFVVIGRRRRLEFRLQILDFEKLIGVNLFPSVFPSVRLHLTSIHSSLF